jgi:MFS transporter, FSR family, fosmidomycin resistance protein
VSRARALLFTSVGHFVNDGSVFFVPLIVDLLLALKGITSLEVFVLLSVFYFVSTVASVAVGKLADKTGKPAGLMALGIACLGLGLIGFYLIILYSSGDEFFVFALLCDFVMGVGSSFYHPLGGSILQSTFGHGTSGRALGLNGSMGSVGRALYPSLFYVAAAVFNKPGSLGFFGLVGLGAALLIWTGIGQAEVSRPTGKADGPSVRRSLTKPMVVLLGVSFVRSAALFGITAYIPIFLSTQRNLGTSPLLGLSLTAFYASAILGQPLFGLLVERFDHRSVLAISALGAAMSIVGYVNSGGVEGIALLSLFGFFTYTGFPLLLSLAADYAAVDASALGNSLVWGLGASGGNSVGPLLVYALALNDYSKLGASFEIMAALAVVSAIGALLIPKPPAKAGP